MSTLRKQFVLSLAMLCAAVAIATVLFLNRPPTEVKEPTYSPVTVDVAEVVPQSLRIPVEAQGTVAPLQQTQLVAEVGGRIIEVSPRLLAGGFVAKGEVLLRIDPRDYETNLLRAKSAVDSAESVLAQEKGRAQVAQREWESLPKGSQRSQEAKQLYLRKPQLEQAKSSLLAAKADLDTARDNLDRTVILAPYDALVRSKQTDVGQFVTVGTPLATVFSVDQAEVRLAIPQSKLAYIELPRVETIAEAPVVDLYTDVAGEIKHWQASLHRTEGIFDERSRVLYAVARVEDPYGLQGHSEPLRIGTFVNANIIGKAFDNLVALPRYVLRAGNILWVIDEDSRLQARAVEILRTGGDTIYVSSGLNPGDKVSLTVLDASLGGAEVSIVSSIPSTEFSTAETRALQTEKAKLVANDTGDGK